MKSSWKKPLRQLLLWLAKKLQEPRLKKRTPVAKREDIFTRSIQVPKWLFGFLVLVTIVLILAYGEINLTKILGIFLSTTTFIGLLVLYLYYYEPKILAKEQSLILIGIISIGVIALAKILRVLGINGYLVPLSMAGILVAVLLRPGVGLVLNIILSIILAIIYNNSLNIFILNLVGGVSGIFSVKKVRHRSDLMSAGLVVSVVNLITIVFLTLLTRYLNLGKIALDLASGSLNGLICGVLTIGVLPYLETIFNLTTDIKLLELADFNQPLLRELIMKAPGTYHHSLLVGNLSENAASNIGANSLLARVGGYYHDIGKLVKPECFIENQEAFNIHDELAPSMSNLILIAHVKEGVEMARQHKLNPEIIDIIQQHHGTGLIYYFYQRALTEQEEQHVQKEQYRYPGPRPQTREGAIILLADAVEAASRTLEDATFAQIQDLVKKIINNKFIDGQLDECNLTLKDLHIISEQFTKVLTGIFHARVEYPR